MRKKYEAPLCQRIEVSEEDILTTSDYVGFDKNDDTPGDFGGGGIIHW